MKKLKMTKTAKNNFVTYIIVLIAYIVVQILLKSGNMSSLMEGLLVPLCIYVMLAISLNLTVGILGELSLG
ncbi:MAG: branched-chain amino acid ABC transporter permease, partial [Kineothrix sp.]|nr:branched-chain amino acid ABC transporter permease [Kineothrix sp.]